MPRRQGACPSARCPAPFFPLDHWRCDVPHYRSVGDVPRKRHLRSPAPGGGLLYEELMGEEGFSSDSSLLYHRGVPSAITDSQVWELPDQGRTPNHPLKPRHLKLHDLPVGGDAVTGRRAPVLAVSARAGVNVEAKYLLLERAFALECAQEDVAGRIRQALLREQVERVVDRRQRRRRPAVAAFRRARRAGRCRAPARLHRPGQEGPPRGADLHPDPRHRSGLRHGARTDPGQRFAPGGHHMHLRGRQRLQRALLQSSQLESNHS